MNIARKLLQELKIELEGEIAYLKQKLSIEGWREVRNYWRMMDVSIQEMDEYCEDIKKDALLDLKIAEEELLQVERELKMLNEL